MNRNTGLVGVLLASTVFVGCEQIEDETDSSVEPTDATTQEDPSDGNGTVGSIEGPADYASFSLASDRVIENAFGTDGITTELTVHVADRHNHPVEDGTVVSFWTELGSIEPNCMTSNGTCAVQWQSGGLRMDGLSTVVASTLGEDSFIDEGERNGIYDVGEIILSAGELFFDYGFDGQYTDGVDAYEDYNNNGRYDGPAGATEYRGTLCSAAAIAADHCKETSVQIWRMTELVLNNDAGITVTTVQNWVAGNTYDVFVSDASGNFPPKGTKITVTETGGATVDFDIPIEEVPSLNQVAYAGNEPYVFEVDFNTSTGAGTFEIQIEFPSGRTKTVTVSHS